MPERVARRDSDVPPWLREILPRAVIAASPAESAYGLWEVIARRHKAPADVPWPSEVDVVRQIRLAGWSAYWRPGIRHTSWEAIWPGEVRSIRKMIKEAPPEVASVLRDIRAAVKEGTRAGFGWPDVTVWDRRRAALRFVEVKGLSEQMRATQRLWLERVIALGVVTVEDIAVVRVAAST
jgi:hypothetical protein